MMNRRDFLKALVAVAAVASLPLSVTERMPILYGDGEHDDTEALNAAIRGERIIYGGQVMTLRKHEVVHIPAGTFLIGNPPLKLF